MNFLIPLIIGLIGSQIGGKGDTYQQKQTTTQTALPRGYQSPMLGILDSLMSSGVLGNLQRLQGAGFPGGAKNPGFGNLSAILAQIMKMQPELLAGTTQGYRSQEGRGASTRPGMAR